MHCFFDVIFANWMLFNSLEYLLFLPVAFALYWSLSDKYKIQNVLLLALSYFFYSCWDWRFLSLIIISSFTDYYVGQWIHRSENKNTRKRFLYISLLVNLGLLGVFKYYNFFATEFSELLGFLGLQTSMATLNVILPVGISFYTFQTLSYTIDIYRGKLEPTDKMIDFFAYVAFFPQLVAGPIERARDLLPQFHVARKFDYTKSVDGLRQMLWGFFKKVVIADNCAPVVDFIFANHADYGSGILVLAVVLFALQLYADFSGYSDIAIGTARLFGFNLTQNFATPYFALSTTTLWRRWHITLSTWANEYVFLPVSSSLKRLKRRAVLLALVITFTLIGLWHGANWTFVCFGLWHGLVVTFEYMTQKQRRQLTKKTGQSFMRFSGWLATILVWLIGCVFFRSATISDAFTYFKNIFTFSDKKLSGVLEAVNLNMPQLYIIISSIIFLFVVEWLNRRQKHGLENTPSNFILRYATYLLLCVLILEYFHGQKSFVYFQF